MCVCHDTAMRPLCCVPLTPRTQTKSPMCRSLSMPRLNEKTFPTVKSVSALPRSTVLSISHNTLFSSHCLRNSKTTAASDVGPRALPVDRVLLHQRSTNRQICAATFICSFYGLYRREIRVLDCFKNSIQRA